MLWQPQQTTKECERLKFAWYVGRHALFDVANCDSNVGVCQNCSHLVATVAAADDVDTYHILSDLTCFSAATSH